MAEEDVYYASKIGTNKRKYEEEQTISRKPTGFSAPISSQSPDASYSTIPPPMDDFQLAKQKAQEIASRLLNTAEPKKPRVDNGAGFDSVERKFFFLLNNYVYFLVNDYPVFVSLFGHVASLGVLLYGLLIKKRRSFVN